MKIFERLLYLDREFVSAMYEAETECSPETKITKTEGLNAGMRIPLMSAGASSVESKTYSVSTIGMLVALKDKLLEYPEFQATTYEYGMSSLICWVNGIITISMVDIKQRTYTLNFGERPADSYDSNAGKTGTDTNTEEKLLAQESFFSIKSPPNEFALISTPDYFTSGVANFRDLARTIISPLKLPVKVLLRVYSAQTPSKKWIAVPLLMIEP